MDRGPLFLQAQLSSTKAYAEEQIIYTLKLYRQVKVSNVSLSLSQAENLVFKQLGDPSEYQSVVQGNTYHVLEVRYAVIPSGTGKHIINPSSMAMTVHQHRERTRRGIFDDPFFTFSRGRPTTLKTGSFCATLFMASMASGLFCSMAITPRVMCRAPARIFPPLRISAGYSSMSL